MSKSIKQLLQISKLLSSGTIGPRDLTKSVKDQLKENASTLKAMRLATNVKCDAIPTMPHMVKDGDIYLAELIGCKAKIPTHKRIVQDMLPGNVTFEHDCYGNLSLSSGRQELKLPDSFSSAWWSPGRLSLSGGPTEENPPEIPTGIHFIYKIDRRGKINRARLVFEPTALALANSLNLEHLEFNLSIGSFDMEAFSLNADLIMEKFKAGGARMYKEDGTAYRIYGTTSEGRINFNIDYY